MSPISECPDCSESISEGRRRCICGWWNAAEPTPRSIYQCQHIENGIRCNEEGISSNRIKGNYWLCSLHKNRLFNT